MKRFIILTLVAGAFAFTGTSSTLAAERKLHIICFGAHPDDCEIQAGGVAAMWAARGHKVKLVSVTNGDIGHWREAGGPLARRRKAEAEAADKILGVTCEVLDIHVPEPAVLCGRIAGSRNRATVSTVSPELSQHTGCRVPG